MKHAAGGGNPRVVEHAANFDMCRRLTARAESIIAVESEALELAQSTNDTSAFNSLKIDDARERYHAIELSESFEEDTHRPWSWPRRGVAIVGH